MTESPHPLPAALAAYAARLLAGTGLSPAAAALAAAGDPGVTVPPAAEPAVRALRDGWAGALAAEPEPGLDLDGPA